MKQSIEITDNQFFSIFSDAVLLYELASNEKDEHRQNTLSKSSILSVNSALEAAANSFLTSIEVNKTIRSKLDKFPTLDKFDFVLQWHKDQQLPRGEKETQVICKLIEQRNALVHPKVKVVQRNVETSVGNEKIGYYHKDLSNNSDGKCPVTKMAKSAEQYSSEDALIAIKSLVDFLNKYVETWWNIDVNTSALLLMRTWNGSVQANPIMYLRHELETVLKYNDVLKIRFVGLYGILEQFA
ncbi:hypothetical protein RG677_002688 [Vibrio parahaemolyticus]|uniref:hypothetical protein n=1 Tax=Gammaproteobacteria TaxID=1236 RepID=UPI00046F7872|nr:hypothetical protein [Vibrio parahaemolyticus]EHK0753522.1 hypothetical protein [Vibrio parahaemolyticus]EJB8572726.1 hypothetical protein [Vibrio parahaemolyticus]ELB2951235.1 hypothetical protein [Vibrio parahaemolyticus]MCR9782802.1 hypothetical protein [Vibrio parahaemolyticus]MCZ6379579.1 hypothetical protein [Vibrio parahaemolyticus]